MEFNNYFACPYFQKKQFFLNGFGLTTVALLYAFSIGRLFLAIEFPFTHEIPVPEIYNRFYQVVKTDRLAFNEYGISFVDAFLTLWCTVSVILIAVFLARSLIAAKHMRSMRFIADSQSESILTEIQQKFCCRLRIQIVRCPDINLPMGIGVFRKRILIPMAEYSDAELRYIILHEYMHFCNKDLQILYLTEIFSKLFWWNPLVYLLKSDIRQILEIRCDLSVISGISETQRIDYLKAIRTCLIQSNKMKAVYSPIVSTNLIRKNLKTEEMLERFRLIAYPVKKNYYRFQTLSIVCFALLMIISYLFILQPQYQPPEDEVFTQSDVESAGALSGYILANKDGTFTFIDEADFEIEIKKETVEQFVSFGFEIREE